MPLRSDILRRFGFRVDNIEDSLQYCYAIYDGSALKIGHTKSHPMVRLRNLQTANPNVLHLVAYTSRMTERFIHRSLWKERLRGEWFKLSPNVLELIAEWEWLDYVIYSSLQESLRVKDGKRV